MEHRLAKDATTVDDYLKPGGIKDQMNDNPQALIDKYKDADPEDIDLVLPYYQNNVHSDEVAGTDSMIHLINEIIAGGTEGKAIPYNNFS
jgi:glycogen synthase